MHLVRVLHLMAAGTANCKPTSAEVAAKTPGSLPSRAQAASQLLLSAAAGEAANWMGSAL